MVPQEGNEKDLILQQVYEGKEAQAYLRFLYKEQMLQLEKELLLEETLDTEEQLSDYGLFLQHRQ